MEASANRARRLPAPARRGATRPAQRRGKCPAPLHPTAMLSPSTPSGLPSGRSTSSLRRSCRGLALLGQGLPSAPAAGRPGAPRRSGDRPQRITTSPHKAGGPAAAASPGRKAREPCRCKRTGACRRRPQRSSLAPRARLATTHLVKDRGLSHVALGDDRCLAAAGWRGADAASRNHGDVVTAFCLARALPAAALSGVNSTTLEGPDGILRRRRRAAPQVSAHGDARGRARSRRRRGAV